VLALTETWHHDSRDVCLRQAAPPDFAVVDVVRPHQPGYGDIAVLYSGQLRCAKVDLPPRTSFEALCTRFRAGNSAWLMLTVYRPESCDASATTTFFISSRNYLQYWKLSSLTAVLSLSTVTLTYTSDACSSRLTELLSCMDLQQHVTSPTHQAGCQDFLARPVFGDV